MNKIKFYTLDNILTYSADYNIIIGERSNGKTTAVLNYALKEYVDSNYNCQLAIIRRWETDFKGKNGQQLFDAINKLGWVKEYTKGRYNTIYYYSQRWYLRNIDNEGNVVETRTEPFALGFSISMEEHYKSTSYPNVKNILFDEFLTRGYYLPDEFVDYQNLLSTIIRLRTNVKIFMCGNTVNKYSPYFSEMGLVNIKKQQRGTIDLYTYGNSELRVAVEYSDFPAKKKASNKYFAFNNPKLKMITNGTWEIDIYPHLPTKYRPMDVLYKFFVLFDREIVQGEIIDTDEQPFIYFHRKTTPLKEDNEQLVYQVEPNYRLHYRVNILKPYGKIDTIIAKLLRCQKVFYQDNEIGEIINNYLKWCKTE